MGLSLVLFGDIMVRNGIFWTIGGQSYLVYYSIISYLKIKFYRFETMNMGSPHWKSDVVATFLISLITTLLIVQDKILW